MFNSKHLKIDNIDYSDERAIVSKLLFDVLAEKITVKEALLKFPVDINDESITAAWHALSHYEADEDLRKVDFDYKKVQDDFIEFVAFSMRDNKDLPVNIIQSYSPYYKDIPTADNVSLKGKMHKLFRFLNIN